MKAFRFLLCAALTLPVALSCESEKALELVNQEAAIDKYITGTYPDNTVARNDGANRVILTEGSGVEAAAGDTVEVQLTGYVFTSAPATQYLSEQVRTVVGKGKLLPGLDRGLTGVRKGESALIIFSAKYGYYDEAVGVVPAMSALCFDALVLDIVKM